MKISYLITYSGYIPVLRSILLLFKYKNLSLSQLGAYIYFVMQADFDNRHPHYGAILRDDKQLANEIGVSHTTIYRQRKNLIKAGLLTEKNNITFITNYHMFEFERVKKLVKLKLPNLQDLFTKPQEEMADLELSIANMQNCPLQKVDQSFNTSSKGNLSSKPEFTEEDQKWIHNYVKEDEGCPC